MKLREDAVYDLIAVTSMGVRITPFSRQPVATSNLFEMQATSAETNVLNIAASLGMRTTILTRFVKDSPIASFIMSELRKRNIGYFGEEVEQGGPWGYRHQFNIADSGFGFRAPKVQNDRAGEVGRTIDYHDYDLDFIFKQQGCKLLHLSGLVAALSESTTEACLKIAEYAKENGSLISFDINYRASFWKDREDELHESFKKIASMADILIGNEEDFQLALGIKGPEAGGNDLSSKIDGFKVMINEVQKEYPNASVYGTTLREVASANEHYWGAIINYDGQWYVEQPRQIQVLDRIGGGDGFVGGLLYGIVKGFDPESCLHFGWASGAMAASLLSDYASPLNEDEIWSIYQGNARVQR